MYKEQLEIYYMLLGFKRYAKMNPKELYEIVSYFWEDGKRFNHKTTIHQKQEILVMANFEDEDEY